MESEETKFLESRHHRVKVNFHRCVVCGIPSVCLKGHLFYQTGRFRFGAPFCKEHAPHFQEYAHPIFENVAAQELFKYMYPRTYRESVEGKQILYFNTYKMPRSSKNKLS